MLFAGQGFIFFSRDRHIVIAGGRAFGIIGANQVWRESIEFIFAQRSLDRGGGHLNEQILSAGLYIPHIADVLLPGVLAARDIQNAHVFIFIRIGIGILPAVNQLFRFLRADVVHLDQMIGAHHIEVAL